MIGRLGNRPISIFVSMFLGHDFEPLSLNYLVAIPAPSQYQSQSGPSYFTMTAYTPSQIFRTDPMICKTCSFETDRLAVNEWHSISLPGGRQDNLAHVVATMLTEPVMRNLPRAWHGDYTVARAREWIVERDKEGTTLLAIEKTTQEPVGLIFLNDLEAENAIDGIEIRLGYLLSEPAWGRGLASELVKGFVAWCRTQAPIATLAGGVDADHPASIRVLEKSGFRPVEFDGEADQGQRMFRLRLR